MEHVQRCTSVLRPLIAAGETNGIPLAERAINDMLKGVPRAEHKLSLDSVQVVVQSHRAAATGSQLGFADVVNDYLEKLMRELE